MNNIPVENYFYLILYSFDLVKDKSLFNKIKLENEGSFSDALISIFILELDKLIRRGIYLNYNSIDEESFIIKGKVNVKDYMLKPTLKVDCNYDEFNSNNMPNKILKYTINKLLFSSNITKTQQKKLKILYTYFQEVDLVNINFNDIKNITLDNQNKYYLVAIKLSLFINHSLIPHSDEGNYNFVDVFKNETAMHAIYESFLKNFYKIHLDNNYNVLGGKTFNWDLEKIEGTDEYRIPTMNTDLEIRNKKTNEYIIIDAKYYTNAFSSHTHTKTMLSNNMYQINTYLMHRSKEHDNLRGILLYPANGFNIKEIYLMKNKYSIEFHTINLNQKWEEIHESLIDIII